MRRRYILTILALVLVACINAWAVDDEEEHVNILQNEGFEIQFENWLFWTEGKAVAERLIDNKEKDPIDGENVAFVEIHNSGAGGNEIQFYQGPFALEKDKTYTLSVWGKTDDDPQPVELRVLKHEDPWTGYAVKLVKFTDTWDEYSVTFDQTVDDNVARMDLFLGNAENGIWIDHVRLHEGEYFNDDVHELPGQPVEARDRIIGLWGRIKRGL